MSGPYRVRPARGNRVIVLYYWQVIETSLQEVFMPIHDTENITCVEPADYPASRVSCSSDSAGTQTHWRSRFLGLRETEASRTALIG